MKRIKWTSIFLAAVLGCGMLLTSCRKDVEKTPAEDGTAGVITEGEYTFESILSAEENHIRIQSATDKRIVENGATEYKVLLPEKPTQKENLAVEELVGFFEEATGIVLDVVRNGSIGYTENAKYISVGETAFAKALDIELTYEHMGQQGFVVQTRGESVIILGQTDMGTLYGVYDLLGEWFHFEYYASEVYAIDKNVSVLPLKNYNIKEVPDIGAMQINYGEMREASGAQNVYARYRMTERAETILPVDGQSSVHNMQILLPYNKYAAAHPYWFTEWKKENIDFPYDENICLTARGDETEYAALLNVVIERIIEQFESGGTGNAMVFGQSDGSPCCTCAACAANTKKYGADSANGILFLNDVLDGVYAWFETEEGKQYAREFYILLLAYETWETGPFTVKNGEVTLNAGLKIHDKMGVMMAPIHYDYGGTRVSSAKNETKYENIVAWTSVCAVSAFYLYDFNNKVQLAPWDTMPSKQELYRLLRDSDAIYLYDQGEWLQTGLPTGHKLVKIFVMNKLRWNVELDVNALIDEYYTYVYGEAAETIAGTYWSFRNHWANMRFLSTVPGSGIENNWVNYLSGRIHRKELWPVHLLVGWLGAYDKAFAEIEGLKNTDTARYEQISLYISAERVSTLYLLLTLYEDRYSDAELLRLRTLLKEDAEKTGVTQTEEDTTGEKTLEAYFKEWGLE